MGSRKAETRSSQSISAINTNQSESRSSTVYLNEIAEVCVQKKEFLALYFSEVLQDES